PTVETGCLRHTPRGGLRTQQQLAGRAPRREEAQCVGCVRERKLATSRYGQLAFTRQTEDGLEAAAVNLVHPVDHRYDEPAHLQRLAEEAHRIDRVRRAAGAAVNDEMPERGEAAEALVDRRLADGIENEIDPTTVGQPQCRLCEVVGPVLDHVIRSEAPYQIHLV